MAGSGDAGNLHGKVAFIKAANKAPEQNAAAVQAAASPSAGACCVVTASPDGFGGATAHLVPKLSAEVAVPVVNVSLAVAQKLLSSTDEWEVTLSPPTPKPNDDHRVSLMTWVGHDTDPAHIYYDEGERVRVHSLQAKPQFNGLLGTVVARLRSETSWWKDGRLGVQLDSGHALKLKPLNLERCCTRCGAAVDYWLCCTACKNVHHALYCSGECASASLHTHRCKPPVSPIRPGYQLGTEQPVYIRGLYQDLGEGIFVYSLEDDDGDDGAIEIRPDGKTKMICGEAMMKACMFKCQQRTDVTQLCV